MKNSTREFESRVEATEAKEEAMRREVAEMRREMEAHALVVEVIKTIVEQVDKGRHWVWIDVKLVEWLDKQVEMGKYRSCSQAVEKIIQSKMREETTRAYEI